MDDINLSVKNEKELETHTNNKNIQSGCRNRIWNGKMCHAHNEKWKR